jgi:acyl-CoA synthetase (NDP forming)
MSAAQAGPFTLAVSSEMVFLDLPVVERIRRISALGFEVEIWDWNACGAAGLSVAPLGEATRARLAAHLPAAANVANPVDMLATATAADFRRTIERVAADPAVDAIVAIFIAPLPGRRSEPVLRAIRAAARRAARDGVPVAAVIMAPHPPAADDVAVYATPEHAARALGHAARHARHLRAARPAPEPPTGVDADAASAVIAQALAAGAQWLGPEQAARLLRAYGLPLAEFELCAGARAASRCATTARGPVALKAIVPGLLHKSDAGAVRLNLSGAAKVAYEASEMSARLARAGHEVEGFVVQEMAGDGVEMLVGVVGDEQFGPVVACAAGGTAVELLGDVQVRLAPVAAATAAAMIRGLRTFPLLDGYRGAPRAAVGALEDVVMRAAALAAAHPQIAELDLNPVVVSPTGALVVDARVRLQPASRPPELTAL